MNYKDILTNLESTLVLFSDSVPLELFIFAGSFLEEIIAPIPSPFVTTIAGSLASTKGYPFIMLFLLAIISAIGKTIGALVIYKIADLSEDVVLSKFGKFLGLSHTAVEKIGTKFHKGGKDWLILSVLRAIPIMPSAPISAVCGLIKMPLSTFIGATIIGNSIRNFIFLYVGYTGLSTYTTLLTGIDSLESILKIGILVVILLGFCWVIWKRKTIHSEEKK